MIKFILVKTMFMMTYRTLFSLFIMMLPLCFFSQGDFDEMKGEKNDLGFSLNVSGLLTNLSLSPQKETSYNQIFARYYLSNTAALRMGLGANVNNRSYSALDSLDGSLVTQDSSFKQNAFYISLGYERHIRTANRLDPYFALTMGYGVRGKSRITNVVSTKDTIGVATLTTRAENPGGSIFNLSTTIGFNYFITHKLSFGAEYALGYSYEIIGGDYSLVIIDTPASGAEKVTRTTGTGINKNSSLSVQGNALITFSYFFSSSKEKE